MRINKLFSNYGICSRKDTVALIEQNRIKVNGNYCVQGQWIDEGDIVQLDDEIIKKQEPIYIAFNKPRGIECTLSNEKENNIGKYIGYAKYIFPVGRLDKESEGLIILTNDGDFSNLLLSAEIGHEKEYVVTVDKNIDDDFINNLTQGVVIKVKKHKDISRVGDYTYKDKNNNEVLSKDMVDNIDYTNSITTKNCIAKKINDTTFKIILTQGVNRQIRKMCKKFGYNVIKLKRTRILNIELGTLEIGAYRNLNSLEFKNLNKFFNY